MGKQGKPVDKDALAYKRERALKLLEMGYSQSLVAQSVGMSVTTVGRWGQEAGLKRPRQPRVRR